MIRSVQNVMGCSIGATDGEVGEVADLYFADQQWTIRYLVVETGAWLDRRKVLISPQSIGRRVLVQKSGTAWRIGAATFKRMTGIQWELRRELNKYALMRLAQVAQNAVCANAHKIEARLARRILMMHGRFRSSEISATHESLANMLGVRHSSVTVAAGTFQEKKIIQYRRGVLTALDRKGLKALSCACKGQP